MTTEILIDYPGKLYYAIGNFLANLGEKADSYWYDAGIIFTCVLIFLAFTGLNEKNHGSKQWYKRLLYSDIFFLLVIYIGILVLSMPNLIIFEQDVDESQWMVGAATLIRNPKFWDSVNGTTGGPLIIFPLTLIHFLGLGINYVTVRLFGLLCCTLPSITFMYLGFRNLFSAKIGKIIILPVVLCMVFVNYRYSITYNGEHMSMLLTSLSIFLYSKIASGSKNKYFYLFCLGFVLGCIPFVKLQAVPIGISIGIMCCIAIFFMNHSDSKTKIKELAYFGISCLLPICIVFTYLSKSNILGDFWQSYIVTNLFYAKIGLRKFEMINGNSFLLRKLKFIVYMPDVGIYFRSLFFVDLSIGAALLGFWKYVTHRTQYLTISSFLVFLGGLFSVIIPKNNSPHYLLLLIMPTLFFTGTLIASSYEYSSFVFKSGAQRLIIKIIVIIIIFLLSFSAILKGSKGIEYIKRNGIKPYKSSIAEKINEYAHPNEKMAVWGWMNKYYIEAGLLQGTREPHIFFQVTKTNQQGYYLQRYALDLTRNKPAVFLDAVAEGSFYFSEAEYRHDNFPLIKKIVNTYYVLTDEINGVRIYIRKDRLVQLQSFRENFK
jgi:hypothetical protein